MRLRPGSLYAHRSTRLVLLSFFVVSVVVACGEQPETAEPSAGPTASLESQKWGGLAAGSSVFGADGRELTIRKDLANITVSLRMRNDSSQDVALLSPASLVGDSGETLAGFRLLKIDGREIGPNDNRIMIPARGSVLLEMQTKLEGYEDLESAGSVYLALPKHGLRLGLEPLPARDDLYETP